MSRALRLIVATLALGALLFLLSGTVAWPAAWACLALVTASLVVHSVILVRLHPDLIQERTRPPADSGPYRVVRPPGYLGSILHMFGTGLALGSWWALDGAGMVSLVPAVRTALEDRTLRLELEGYADYAGRVRFRLVPGIW